MSVMKYENLKIKDITKIKNFSDYLHKGDISKIKYKEKMEKKAKKLGLTFSEIEKATRIYLN